MRFLAALVLSLLAACDDGVEAPPRFQAPRPHASEPSAEEHVPQYRYTPRKLNPAVFRPDWFKGEPKRPADPSGSYRAVKFDGTVDVRRQGRDWRIQIRTPPIPGPGLCNLAAVGRFEGATLVARVEGHPMPNAPPALVKVTFEGRRARVVGVHAEGHCGVNAAFDGDYLRE